MPVIPRGVIDPGLGRCEFREYDRKKYKWPGIQRCNNLAAGTRDEYGDGHYSINLCPEHLDGYDNWQRTIVEKKYRNGR